MCVPPQVASGLLAGPEPVEGAACTLGRRCEILLRGVAQARTNALVALEAGTCGAEDAVAAAEPWSAHWADAVAGNGSNASYRFGTPAAGVPGVFDDRVREDVPDAAR